MAAASHGSSTSLSITVLPSSGRQAMRMPLRSPSACAAATKPVAGSPKEWGSDGCWPAMASSISAVSMTVRVIGLMLETVAERLGRHVVRHHAEPTA